MLVSMLVSCFWRYFTNSKYINVFSIFNLKISVMTIITWLLSRVLTDDEGSIETESLYNAFDFEMLESGACTKYTKTVFEKHVLFVFPTCEKKRTKYGNKNVSLFEGIILKSITEKERSYYMPNACSIDELKSLLPESVNSYDRNSASLAFNIETNVSCDGNNVMKKVTLFSNGTWTLHISGKEVDLSSVYVSNRFSATEEGVQVVIASATMLKLCDGVKVSKSVIVTRYHTLNLWQTGNQQGRRVLHSLMCSKVVALDHETCRRCQKMTFHYSSNIPKESEILTDSNKENTQFEKEIHVEEKQAVTREAIRALIPGANDNMVEMFYHQAQNALRDPKGRRWSQSIVIFCLKWYCRSPKSYENVRKSGFLLLPSKDVLIKYKTRVKQKVGFDDDLLRWMYDEAKRQDLCEEGRFGGLILDEMSIQADIEITKSGDVIELEGFIDCGKEGNLSHMLRVGNQNKKVATHVLQMLFLGVTGFRFPIAHFLTDGAQIGELQSTFWLAVDKLSMYDFRVVYTCLDGAQSNRSFMNANISLYPESFKCQSECLFSEMVFLMDFSHVVKKIRNNISKSGCHEKATRNLVLDSGNLVQWQMFIDCYHWNKKNIFQLHSRLTNEHIYLTNQSKMRNHLAEDVLDSEMLHLFIQYQSDLGDNDKLLDGVIELLKQTSKLISIFRDMRPIRTLSDERLSELTSIANWFKSWECNALSNTTLSKKERGKRIMSTQAHEDIQSCIVGFVKLCHLLLSMSSKVYITPGLINSDVVENTFNQQRSTYSGANCNPNAPQYRRTLNSILLGQSSISQKGNASRNRAAVLPYNCLPHKPKSQKRNIQCNEDIRSIKVIRL